VTSTAAALLDAWLRRADELAAERALADEPGCTLDVRRAARDRFARRGFPTVNDEDWKYTSLAALSKVALSPRPVAGASPALALAREALAERYGLRVHGGLLLVFVDGRFAPTLSSGPELPEGAHVGSLRAALQATPGLVERALGRTALEGDRPLLDLSTALFEDGPFLHLGQGTCLPVPIEVLHLISGGAEGTVAVSAPRTLLVLEPETRVTLVERFLSLGTGAAAVLPSAEIVLGRNAAIEHVLWQELSDEATFVGSIDVRQDRDSRFTGHAITTGAALSRSDVNVLLDAEGAECSLNGLSLVGGTRHADHHTKIVHAKPHGSSRELYKAILDGRATGVFNGKVIVRPGAVKTDAKQASHNLLLSDDATVDTKPELEIENDDVKCAHGATVGRLEDEKVFYLRSRGLEEGEARELLVRGFVRDVTDRISVLAVREGVEATLSERLPSLLRADGLPRAEARP